MGIRCLFLYCCIRIRYMFLHCSMVMRIRCMCLHCCMVKRTRCMFLHCRMAVRIRCLFLHCRMAVRIRCIFLHCSIAEIDQVYISTLWYGFEDHCFLPFVFHGASPRSQVDHLKFYLWFGMSVLTETCCNNGKYIIRFWQRVWVERPVLYSHIVCTWAIGRPRLLSPVVQHTSWIKHLRHYT